MIFKHFQISLFSQG